MPQSTAIGWRSLIFAGVAWLTSCTTPALERGQASTELPTAWSSVETIAPDSSVDDGAHFDLLVMGSIAPNADADALADALEFELARGRPTLLLWMGSHRGEPVTKRNGELGCQRSRDSSSLSPRLRQLITNHTAHGGTSLQIAGLGDWLCERNEGLQRQTILRVLRNGRVEEAINCEDRGHCRWRVPTAPVHFELILVDLAPRILAAHSPSFPLSNRSRDALEPNRAIARKSARRLDTLIDLLESPPRSSPPRILVSHIPLESAGLHGGGSRSPYATYLQWPARLRRLIATGGVRGVISGHEPSHQAIADLSPSIKRSARTWLLRPVFQVIAGTATRDPIQGRPRSGRWLSKTGTTTIPDFRSLSPGFARITIAEREIAVRSQIQRSDGWFQASLRLPLTPVDHPAASPSPNMTPCLYCDPNQGAADADRYPQARHRRPAAPRP